jgi:putative ABC transport system substrate-binding protein
MRRREFIAGLVGAVAWSLAARAQQGERVRRIGVIMSGDENDSPLCVHSSACRLGLTDGRNVRMELQWGGADANRIRAFAQELVGLQSDIIPGSLDRGDPCPLAGDADDPDRLCERGRPRH